MDFFNDEAVAFALICAAVAVGWGLYFTWWLLKQPAEHLCATALEGARF